MTTASEVSEALRHDLIRRPEAPSGIFMTEIGAPDGKRRADALFIPAVGGGGIHGYEIKVSRSDVLAELADPHKAESWKKYCVRWWLVVSDSKLVEGLEIPEEWGIKHPPTQANRRAFTVIRPAPTLDPHPLGPALSRIATVWAYRQHEADRDSSYRARSLEQKDQRIAELEDKLRRAGRPVSPPPYGQERAIELLKKLRDRGHGYGGVDSRADLDALADAVIEATSVVNLRSATARAAQQTIDNINNALKEFSKKSWHFSELYRLLDEAKVA